MLSPISDPSGVAVVATVRDATDRRIAEQKMATSEAMFRALYDQAPDGIVAVDRDGRIVQVNRMVETMFGYELGELPGRPIEVLVPERFRAAHVGQRRSYSEQPRTRPMGEGRDLFAARKDGTEFPVDILLSPVQVPGTEMVISVVRDVTERKRAEREAKERAEQLARSNRELEQFAYVASHDLQEPLRAVAASCQVLEKRLAGKLEGDTGEFLGFAIDGAKRMQELISDLLAYSRVARESRELVPVDLAQVVRRVLVNLQPRIQETGAEIKVAALPTVRGDPTQLGQLLQNLLTNAMKFHGAKRPEVAVSVAEADGMWRFAVADNGIGIDAKFKDKIFVIFQRLHRREEYPGTGIGLAICKRVVERHGGEIWVESTPGAGATFHFTLPR
jgi:PAS domain S-box-containing protein